MFGGGKTTEEDEGESYADDSYEEEGTGVDLEEGGEETTTAAAAEDSLDELTGNTSKDCHSNQ